jgi:amino acid transporter
MGGAKVGFYTGWLNLLGLFGCVASVAYGCATFFDLSFSSLSPSWAEGYSLQRVFIMFIVLLVLIAALNIGSGHLMATLNNISVWWHVFGAAFIVGVLVILP